MDDMNARSNRLDADRPLVDAVLRDGDERAFRELYDRHTPRLLAFVARLLARSDAEAEDLVQETWIRACSRMDTFRWNAAFSTWLHGIGLNVVRDRLRRDGRSRVIGVEEPPENPVTPPPHVDRIALERAIAGLADGYRLVLVLHDVEGMKHREIAESMGISVGTSKSQLFTARRLVRAALNAGEPKQGDAP